MKSKLLTTSACVCALFDRVDIGPTSLLDSLDQADLDALRHRLTLSGLLDVRKSASFGPHWMALDLPHPTGVGSAAAELAFTRVGERAYRMTEQSVVRFNLLSYLREAGYAAHWPASHDGKTNYIGPFPPDCTELLEKQLAFSSEMIEELRNILGANLPGEVRSQDESSRVRAAELTRDVEGDDALGRTQLLAHSMLHDACLARRDVYRASSDTDIGFTAVRWWIKRDGPVLKTYAKAPRLPRYEAVCGDRDAVKAGHGGAALRADFSGAGVRQLLVSLLPNLLPLLDRLHGHAEDVIAGTALPSDLALELSLMLAAMGRVPTGGRPVSPDIAAEVACAYNAITLTGSYRARGLRKGTTLFKLLRQLSADDWPLVKHPTRHQYSLHPRLVRASYRQTRQGEG